MMENMDKHNTNHDLCPFCNSKNIEFAFTDNNGNEEHFCRDCDNSWKIHKEVLQ